MKIEKIGTNKLAVNSYIIYEENSKEAIIVDPAVNYSQINDFISEKQLQPIVILLTHGHIDHIADTLLIKEKYHINIIAHKKENEMLLRPELNLAPTFGYGDLYFSADQLIRDGDLLELGPFKIKVMHTPGHTKGGVCYLIEDQLITGDTLFAGSMGRTDLYGGNDEHMRASLYKLSLMDDNIVIHPGHGGSSTIGNEKRSNPFMRGL